MGKRSNAARALACAAPRHYHSVRHSRQRCGRIARRLARLASGSPELPRRASAPFAHLCTISDYRCYHQFSEKLSPVAHHAVRVRFL